MKNSTSGIHKKIQDEAEEQNQYIQVFLCRKHLPRTKFEFNSHLNILTLDCRMPQGRKLECTNTMKSTTPFKNSPFPENHRLFLCYKTKKKKEQPFELEQQMDPA
uniref:Uncharacterized protein n=1 Tax=Cacopsylla melanoneura TaxID=428564 RepID=A0A8D8RB82_9HEMI